MSEASACVGGWHACGLEELSDDLVSLESGGRWVVALPYRGRPVLARFSRWTDVPDLPAGSWRGPSVAAWQSSVDAARYMTDVDRVRDAIAAGDVYQANLCRVLSAPIPDAGSADPAGLHQLLSKGNPAPFGGFLSLPAEDLAVVSASPELFLSVRPGRQGRVIRSGPIKGTGRTAADLQEKDRAENVMIVDLVRNDLSQVSQPGSVTVPSLLRIEEHPGLVHLVSTVQGVLEPSADWSAVLDATFPPGSVTGAPKSSALRLIDSLEPASREFYCGAFGWIDADSGEAELAVAIRTFWMSEGLLKFGTGAGVTWASDPRGEWEETELKARNLISVASGSWPSTSMES